MKIKVELREMQKSTVQPEDGNWTEAAAAFVSLVIQILTSLRRHLDRHTIVIRATHYRQV
jgi:hypothetical protein